MFMAIYQESGQFDVKSLQKQDHKNTLKKMWFVFSFPDLLPKLGTRLSADYCFEIALNLLINVSIQKLVQI